MAVVSRAAGEGFEPGLTDPFSKPLANAVWLPRSVFGRTGIRKSCALLHTSPLRAREELSILCIYNTQGLCFQNPFPNHTSYEPPFSLLSSILLQVSGRSVKLYRLAAQNLLQEGALLMLWQMTLQTTGRSFLELLPLLAVSVSS